MSMARNRSLPRRKNRNAILEANRQMRLHERQRRQLQEQEDVDESDDEGHDPFNVAAPDATRAFAIGNNASANQDDDSNNQNEQDLGWRLNKRNKVSIDREGDRIRDGQEDAISISDEIIEQSMIAFCCKICKCGEEQKSRIPADDQYVQSDKSSLFHRRCCHRVIVAPVPGEGNDRWMSPAQAAIEKAKTACLEGSDNEFDTAMKLVEQGDGQRANSVPKPNQLYTWKELERRYINSKAQESESHNDNSKNDQIWELNTFPGYEENRKQLDEKTKSRPKEAAVVLDLFGGVGTGLLCLKRIGIDIKKIICSEHDRVALHVYKSSHDREYRQQCGLPPIRRLEDDDIVHAYHRKFSRIVNNFELFMTKHGPIDIVIAGPPCADFAKVNSYAQGLDGVYGRYMNLTAKLIRKISQAQDRQLFYLIENVPMNRQEIEVIKKNLAIDWDPVEIDAKDVSPCRRKRYFFTNIPQNNLDHKYAAVSASSCLEGGFRLAASFFEEHMLVKSQCFMASKSRVDDSRMSVFKKQKLNGDDLFLERPINIREREAMMGFPEGYIQQPELFTKVQHASLCTQTTEEYWAKITPRPYHKFAGNYHNHSGSDHSFRYDIVKEKGGFPVVKVKMAPPNEPESTVSFFNEQDYAKRLIGNAFSVPVVEFLLKPLRKYFKTKTYQGYDYSYRWTGSPAPVPTG